MAFWLIAFALTGLVALVLGRQLLKPGYQVDSDRNFDLQVYRDQLAGIESDLARGVLTEDEAKRTRVEISRRVLDADKAQAEAQVLPVEKPGLNRIAAGLVAAVLLGGSFGVYWQIGANGAPDLPLVQRRAEMAAQQANRPGQAAVEAQVGNQTAMAGAEDPSYIALVDQLRDTAGKRPDDLRGQQLLAQHEARLGNFAAARKAQQAVVALLGDKVQASDYADLAELMIVAADGYVSPEAEQALTSAVKLDPRDGRTRYYSGLDLAQNGRADLAYQIWSGLLAQGPQDAPWIAPIREQIGEVARLAGVEPTLPGPSVDEVNEAAGMAPDDQQAMIRGMVARLSARLASEGGSADEWARLIRAYGVLKQTDKAAEIWTEAKAKFAGDAAAMAVLSSAAQTAGITP